MIVHLPKDLRYDADPIYLPEDDPYLVLQPGPDGAFLISMEGKLVGQSLFDEAGATVSIGDAKSYRVENTSLGVRISPLVPDEKAYSYEPFGNVPGANYTLYEYRPGSRQPFVAARVTPEPLDPAYYYADLDEGSNVFRTLLLVLTVARVANEPPLDGKKRK